MSDCNTWNHLSVGKQMINIKQKYYYLSVFLFLRCSFVCNILCVIFRLLSSTLLLLAVTQSFGRCILRPYLGVPSLSEYGNDSTREIIFKTLKIISFGWGYNIRNVVLQITTIKMKTTVWKITHKKVSMDNNWNHL